jgi:thiamine-phosphate pyrophosphorylase
MSSLIDGLYAITPDGLAPALLMELADAAIAGGATAVQYRDKQATREEREVCARALVGLCRARHVPLIVNDHLELAQTIGADGLHLGREDGALEEARLRLGKEALIGVSCYASIAAAEKAQRAGASYVAFGSVFASPTKPQAPGADLSLFSQARDASITIPLVGIGGIDADNIGSLAAAGASAAAVIFALFGQPQRDAVFARARTLSLHFRKP